MHTACPLPSVSRRLRCSDKLLREGTRRTTLVIAHRLSTIERVDRIVVLQHGRIAETGTHAELLEKGGVYAQLHRIQFAMTAPPESA